MDHAHWDAVKNENDILAKNQNPQVSVREHLLEGSGPNFPGSPFISTTSELDIALKFACPFNRLLAIDMEMFVAEGGSYIDLRSDAEFRSHVSFIPLRKLFA